MRSSFADPGNWESDNKLLAEDRKAMNDLGVIMSPSVTINSHPYSGELKGELIFKELCNAH